MYQHSNIKSDTWNLTEEKVDIIFEFFDPGKELLNTEQNITSTGKVKKYP